jgi:hypothetical protein
MSGPYTVTYGTPQPTPSIQDFIDAAARVQHLKPPKSELRLHPDDIHELERQLGVKGWPTPIYFGMRVIADSSVPRLPRRWVA